ncbi:MAG: hypothetical protein AB7U39_25720, partial [Ilumatobacteraceae bacterium]
MPVFDDAWCAVSQPAVRSASSTPDNDALFENLARLFPDDPAFTAWSAAEIPSVVSDFIAARSVIPDGAVNEPVDEYLCAAKMPTSRAPAVGTL